MKVRIIYPSFNIVYTDTFTITSNCSNCSFEYVATLLVKYLKKYYNVNAKVNHTVNLDSRLLIGDIFATLESVNSILIPSRTVLWLDTAWIESDRPIFSSAKNRFVLTTSKWNSELLKSLGVDNAIIPRAINDDLVIKYFNDNPKNKKYDFVSIMTGAGDEHKNEKLVIKALKEIGKREKSFLVCSLPECDAKPFTLTEDEKFQLLANSRVFIWLSESEGFGLPPTEAMGVGTPVVHFDSPYVAGPFAIDVIKDKPVYTVPLHFPIPVYGFKKRRSPTITWRYFPSPIYDYNDVVDVMKEALSYAMDMSSDDALSLHEYVMENFSHKVILPRLEKYVGGWK